MWRNNCVWVFAVLVVLAMPGFAGAADITLANPSFELPNPLAGGDYQYGIPGWTLIGTDYQGILKNNAFRGNVMENCDGDNFAFTPLWAGGSGLYQDIPVTVEAGNIYSLTAGFAQRADEKGEGYGDATGAGMLYRLFYRPVVGGDANEPMADTTVMWESLNDTAFTDVTVSLEVKPGDACVGKTMGILLFTTAFVSGVDLSVDNFRLTVTPVPEPSSIALALSGIGGLLAYAWRKRR